MNAKFERGLLKDTGNMYEGERNNLAVDAPYSQGEVLDEGTAKGERDFGQLWAGVVWLLQPSHFPLPAYVVALRGGGGRLGPV